MANTLDKFGFGLSIVLLLLYWHTFNNLDQSGFQHSIGTFTINSNIGMAYTVSIFFTEIFVFGQLIFGKNEKLSCIILRSVGWLLILLGYGLFLYLGGGDGNYWDILNQRGGGFNRF